MLTQSNLNFKFSYYGLHQNTYLSSPHTSTETIRYYMSEPAILKMWKKNTFCQSSFFHLTQGQLNTAWISHLSYCINPLRFIEHRTMARYFCYHDRFTWHNLQLGVSDMPLYHIMHMLLMYCYGQVVWPMSVALAQHATAAGLYWRMADKAHC